MGGGLTHKGRTKSPRLCTGTDMVCLRRQKSWLGLAGGEIVPGQLAGSER